MKPAAWIVGGILLLVVVAFSLLWSSANGSTVTPPGQYSLNEKRNKWPVAHTTHVYRPSAEMGSDEAPFTAADVKFKCGASDTCAFPTVA